MSITFVLLKPQNHQSLENQTHVPFKKKSHRLFDNQIVVWYYTSAGDERFFNHYFDTRCLFLTHKGEMLAWEDHSDDKSYKNDDGDYTLICFH